MEKRWGIRWVRERGEGWEVEREGKRGEGEGKGTLEIHRFLSLLPLGGIYYPEEVLTRPCLTLAIRNNIHGFPGTNSYMSLPKGMV